MANDERWIWDQRLNRYRNERTGRMLPAKRIQDMRDGLLNAATVVVGILSEHLTSGDWSVGTWERGMRNAIKTIFGVQYVFGRGGLKAMQPADWKAVGDLVQAQYGYLKGFADDVADGKLSKPQIMVRAELYVGSSVQAHEAGKGASFDVELPAQPGDGSAPCLANDRCAWHLRRRKDGAVEATWVADVDDRTCKTCRKRAKDWNPLVLFPANPRLDRSRPPQSDECRAVCSPACEVT